MLNECIITPNEGIVSPNECILLNIFKGKKHDLQSKSCRDFQDEY